jgi:phage-related holin
VVGLDRLLIALLVFMVLDYITGLMRAIADKTLSSAIGLRAYAGG